MTKTIVVGIAIFLVLALAVAIWLIYSPPVKDAYFAMDERNLERAPAGLDVIRPTHFSLSIFRKGIIWTPGRRTDGARIMGRNVSLRDIIAVAWQAPADRVVMPAGAPTNNFDFIVTVSQPRKQLQKAIRRQFGYTVDKESVETEVLALKVADPSLPGLTVSAADEKQDTDYKKGRLYVTHVQLKALTGSLEQILKTPLVDETGLTNYYDLSLAWNRQLQERLSREATARLALDKILSDWGLALEPDTASMEMLVIKNVH